MAFEDTDDSTLAALNFRRFPHYALITDDLGQKWRLYKYDDGLTSEDYKYMEQNKLTKYSYDKAVKGRISGERKLIEKLPTYIPLLVRSGDVNLLDDDSSYRTDIIIWFEPSEDLFNALPERISADLRTEYQEVFVNNNTSSQSCKYFEACQNHPGAIESLVVYPNPTDDELNVEFNLSASRIVNASIYSISGQLMKHLWVQKSCEKGANKFNGQLNEMLPGVYILVVETDKGDIISKRIVRR